MSIDRLRHGRQFQQIVQRDFLDNNKDGIALVESPIPRGRLDILIEDLGDFVAIYEIKATNWDRIRPDRVNRNLYRHQRQLFRYVDEYVSRSMDVTLGIIYPTAPTSPGLREYIENRLTSRYGTPAYWFDEIKSS